MARKQGCFRSLRNVILTGGSLLTLSSALSAEEFIVKLKGNHDSFSDKVFQIRAEQGLAILDAHVAGQLIKIDLDNTNKNALAKRLVSLLNHPEVAYVVPNIKMHAFDTAPNDPKYSEQWSHPKVNSEAAWTITPGDRKVIVAVIDTGVDYEHEDLKANIWTNPKEIPGNNVDDDNNGFVDDVHGWDFKGNDASPQDETSDKNPGHGTHCSGIVGATGNNGVGISGMAQQVSIMPIRFLGADGSGDLMAGAKAIDYAVTNGAHVISASWGAAVPASGAQPIIDAIGRANDKGVIFVAAAANDGKDNDSRAVFPANAAFPNMISVAASQSDDSKPSWSNFGVATVHVASPGHEIFSTLPKNTYGKLSGTSMATPKVAGLVALMLSATEQKLNGLEVRSLLQTTGAKVSIETACDCRIDAAAAVSAVTNNRMTVVPAAITLPANGTQSFSALGATGPLQFKLTNSDIASIDANGLLTAKALGETSVIVTDAANHTASSLKIRIADVKAPSESSCPLGEDALCMIMCLFDPTLPWCEQM